MEHAVRLGAAAGDVVDFRCRRSRCGRSMRRNARRNGAKGRREPSGFLIVALLGFVTFSANFSCLAADSRIRTARVGLRTCWSDAGASALRLRAARARGEAPKCRPGRVGLAEGSVGSLGGFFCGKTGDSRSRLWSSAASIPFFDGDAMRRDSGGDSGLFEGSKVGQQERPKETSLFSTFFSRKDKSAGQQTLLSSYELIGYSARQQSIETMNGGAPVEMINRLFLNGGINLAEADLGTPSPSSRVSLLENNGAVVIAVDAYARSQVREKQLDFGDPYGTSFYLNSISYSSGSRPAASKLPPFQPITDVIRALKTEGFTSGDIVTIFTHEPSVAFTHPSKVTASAREILSLLCDELSLRRYDARKIIRSTPKVLAVSGSARGIIKFLSFTGVSMHWLKRNKTFLSYVIQLNPKQLLRTALFLCENGLVGMEELPNVIKNPSFREILDTFVAEKDPKSVKIAYDRLDQVCGALKQCKYGEVQVSRIVQRYPKVLVLEGGASKIQRVCDFLVKDVGMDPSDVPRCLESYPALLGASTTCMGQCASFLRTCEVGDSDLGKVVKAFPFLLTLDVHDMKKVVRYLQIEIGIVNVGRFITRIPPILSHDVEKELMPRWEVLKEQNVDSFHLARFPAFFSYPLRRIKCRYEFLGKLGVPAKTISIDCVLRGGDEDFAAQCCKVSPMTFREYVKEFNGEGKAEKMRTKTRRPKKQHAA